MATLLSKLDLQQLILESTSASANCFAIAAPDLTILYCNAPYADIYGLTLDEVIGRKSDDLFRLAWHNKRGVNIEADDIEIWLTNLRETHKRQAVNEFEMDLLDGRWFKMSRITVSSGVVILTGTDITELKNTKNELQRSKERIEQLLMTDELTLISNRRCYTADIEREFERAKRYQQPLSLMMIDIDHFKNINDSYGHEAGDRVLKEVAIRCQRAIRQCDSIYRIGGEEFVILLPETDVDDSAMVAERIRNAIVQRPFVVTDTTEHQVTISIGIAQLNGTEEQPHQLQIRADKALYQAKHSGRNRYEVVSNTIN